MTTSTPPDALPASKEAEAVAWLHAITEPGASKPMTMFSRSANNPWSHWLAAHRDKCTYVVTPLYAHPHTDAGVSEAATAACDAFDVLSLSEAYGGSGATSVSSKDLAALDRAIRALRATAIPAGDGVPTWHPIETAPKEGTRFLAYEKGRYFDCWWHENGYGEAYWMDEADSEPNPSNWMPLPAPPLSTASTAGEG